MIEAGSETTTMMLNWLYVAILSKPKVLVKAHEELDRVIGSDRTPTFEDEHNLPYIRAMLKVYSPRSQQKLTPGNASMASNKQVRTDSLRNTSSTAKGHL
jgi:hypothetical protein